MRRLPEKFTKYGQQFEQICRTEQTAIYRRHTNGRQKSYEVIIVRVADRSPVKLDEKVRWEKCEPYECYPSSEKWGTCGWTYSTEEDARAKYDLINDPRYKLPAPPIYPLRARATDGIAQKRVSLARSIKTADAEEKEAA